MSELTTKAGKALLEEFEYEARVTFEKQDDPHLTSTMTTIQGKIAAIEDEAAELDVERLRRAIGNVPGFWEPGVPDWSAVAAAYCLARGEIGETHPDESGA